MNDADERTASAINDDRTSWWAHEHTLTAAMTAASLLLLFLIVQVFFPTGDGLGDDQRTANRDSLTGGSLERNVQLDGARGGITARIDQVRRNVRVKTAGGVAWDVASVGDELADRDAVQTLANSRATLRLGDGGHLVVNEKSLLILESSERDPLFDRQQATMVMMAGQLSGSLGGTSLGIRIPNSSVHLTPEGDADELEFRLAVNEDKSTNVDILAGSATVMSGNRRVRVFANQGVRVSPDGLNFEVADLPATPSVVAPTANARVRYRGLRPSVDFSWRAVGDADGYRVTIAGDANFTRIVSQAKVAKPRFTHSNLSAGRYFWRVTSLRDGRQSRSSDARRIALIEDRRAPGLQVSAPAKIVSSTELTLRGSTDPGSRVYVGGEPVSLSGSGDFEYVMRLDAGANRIIVESVDQVGNVSYASYTVIAKPQTSVESGS